MKTFLTTIYVMCALILTSCGPVYKNEFPVNNIDEFDSRLVGVWEGEFMLSKTYLHIYQSIKDEKSLNVIFIIHSKPSGSSVKIYEGFPFTVTGNSFFNAKTDEGNLVFHYKLISEKELYIGFIPEEDAKGKIKKNKLEGEVLGNSVLITSKGDGYLEYISNIKEYVSTSSQIKDNETYEYYQKISSIESSMKVGP